MDKSIVIYPGLRLYCNRGRNMLIFEINGISGFLDLSQCENQEAVDAWIRDVELEFCTQEGPTIT